MSWAIAMDCDGTLEVGSPPGPIKLEWLRILEERGHRLVLIGNPSLLGYYQLQTCPLHGSGDRKSDELDWFREQLSDTCKRWIVVDDNPAQYRRGFRNWEHFMPQDFLEEILHNL